MLGLGFALTNFGTKGGVVDTPDLSGSSAAALLAAYGGEGFSMIFDGTAPSLKITDSTTPSNDWDSDLGDGYSVQDFFKSRSFTSYTGPVSSGKRLMQADGYIKPCRHNLLKLSEVYPNATASLGPWTNTSDNVTRGQADPFGTTKASLITTNVGSVLHRIYQVVYATITTPVTCSYYAKANGYNYVYIREESSTGAGAVFDLSGSGSVVGTYNAGAVTISGATIEAVSGYAGWFRVSCVMSVSSSTSMGFGIGLPNQSWTSGDPATSWSADGISGVYVAFPQVNAGSQALDYVSSEAHNLCLQSQTFQTTWSPTNTGVTADATTAPDGTTTADKLTETAVTDTFRVSMTITSISGTNYTCTVRAKAAERSWVLLRTNFGSVIDSYFNCSTGAQGTIGSGHTAHTPVALANGWYEFSVTVASTTTGSSFFNVGPANADAAGSYAGTLSSGIYVWGGQVELSSTPGKYVATTTASVYNQHFDIPVEYNTDGTVKALTREEARTNLALYSNALATSPWGANLSTVTNNAVASPSGRTDATSIDDLTSAGAHNLYQAVTLSSGTTYTLSVYLKDSNRQYVSVSLNRAASASTYFAARFDLTNIAATSTSVGSTSGSISAYGIEDVGNGWRRAYITGIVGAITDGLIVISPATDGTTWTADARGLQSYTGSNKVFYAWGVQCEAASTKSSLIITGSAAVTRAVDDIYVATTVFPHSATEWTVYQKMTQDYLVSFAAPYSLSNETTAERHDTYLSAAGAVVARTTDGGADQASITPSGTISAATAFKFASAVKVNDFAACLNGGTVGTDVSGTVPTVYRFRLGGGQSNGSPMHGGVHESMYVPTRLADATLQTLTTA